MYKWVFIVDVCPKYIKPNSKYSHSNSKFHQKFDDCKHIILSHKDIDIKDVDEAFYSYIIEHNKKFDYYLVKCEFKIIFNIYEFCPYVTSNLSDIKTMIPWKNFSEKVIDDFKDKRYNFNHIAEMHTITMANKMDMSYDFYIKHNMCALEWKLNAMINKNKSLITKFDQIWKHPLSRNFESYRL